MTQFRPLTRVVMVLHVLAALGATVAIVGLQPSPAAAVSASSETEVHSTALLLERQTAARAALLAEQRFAEQRRRAEQAARLLKPAPQAARVVTKARVVARPAPVVRRVTKPVVRTETVAQRGARILASLHYPWQQLGYRIEFLPDKHGYLGLTTSGVNLIQIYIRPSESDVVLSHSIAHELGHALDFSRGAADKRAQYLKIRGLRPDLTWFGCNGCSDFQTPAGDWAEVFAYWLAGPGDFRSQVAGPPSAAQLRALTPLFTI